MGRERALHDDQVDEIDRRRLVQDLRHILLTQSRRERSISEPQNGERNAIPLSIPISHRERRHRFQQTENQVRLKQKLPIDQLILLRIPRRAQHDIGLGLLVRERGRSGAVGETANDNHKKRAEDLGQAEDDIGHDGPELAEGAGGQEVADGFLEVVEDHAAVEDGLHNGGEGFQQDHIGGFDGDVGAAARCDADVGLLEGGSVVDAVARHGHEVFPCLVFLDDAQFLFGGGAGEDDFVVIAQSGPLVVVQVDEFWSAEHNRCATALSHRRVVPWRDFCLDRQIRRRISGQIRDIVNSAHGVRDDSTVSSYGLRRELEVSRDHENADSGSAQNANDFRDLIAWRVDDADQSYEGQAGSGVLQRFGLKVVGGWIALDDLCRKDFASK